MKVILSVFEKSTGSGTLLLVEDGKILNRINHTVNFRGMTRLGKDYFVIDKKGEIFLIKVQNNLLTLHNFSYIDGIEDAHDLYSYKGGFITSCTANNYAVDTDEKIYRPFLVHETILSGLKTNNQDLYHLNSFAPYKDGFLLSVFTDIPLGDNSRWRDRNARGAVLFWNQYGFQDVLAENLSQPHSIRVFTDDLIYYCNSKKATLNMVFNDRKRQINPKGFIRGMDFYHDNVIVGHSKSRVMDAGQCGYSIVGKNFYELNGNFKEVYDLLVLKER